MGRSVRNYDDVIWNGVRQIIVPDYRTGLVQKDIKKIVKLVRH